MKNFVVKRYNLLLFIAAAFFTSCNRPEGKDLSKGDPTNNVIVDTLKTLPAQTPTPVGPSNAPQPEASNEVTLVPNSPGGMPEAVPPSDVNRSAPIGSVPILRPEQLAEFHPRLPDFNLAKVNVVDKPDESQSIILFKYRDDTTRTLRSTVIDINERAGGKLIFEMSQMQMKKQETKVVDGESITSHYLKISDMPAIKAYITSKNLATLYILVGDHRAVVLREHNVTSPDHIVEVAKTIDFKRLETLTRN